MHTDKTDQISKGLIAILDDDEDFLNWLTISFKNSGFKLITATTVKDFSTKIKLVTPDLFIIDLNLAEAQEAGYSIIKILNKLYTKPKIFLCSSCRDDAVIEQIVELGACDLIAKPVDFFILDKKIDLHLFSTQGIFFRTIEEKTCYVHKNNIKIKSISPWAVTFTSNKPICRSEPLFIKLTECENLVIEISRWEQVSENLYQGKILLTEFERQKLLCWIGSESEMLV